MSPSETERLAALREYNILDTPPESAFDRITALAAELFGTPIAAISLIDVDRQWFKSIVGLDATQTGRQEAFCDHTIRSDEVLVIPDAHEDARFRDNPLVLSDPKIRFYAGAPLTLRTGHRLGALCIIDRQPRETLSETDRRRLLTLAQIVVNEMDLRLSAERLALARKQADAANAAKSEFLANMSHEVRTPLTSIIGFAGLLGASKTLGDQERRFVDKIATASNNLLAIVNDVLDLARLEAGELTMTVEPVDAVPVVASAVDLVAAQAEAKGLSLHFQAPAAAPPVMVDAARLRQVVLNLVSNAVKFTESGSVAVRFDAEEGRLGVSVSDTGIGISPERLDQIFERFAQADTSISRRFGGAGLGLTISRRLLEQMGGELSVTSTPGVGSCFRVTLPAAS